MIKIILADDHRLFLEGLTAILSSIDKVTIVATASNGNQVLDLLRIHSCDMVVMDINMPVADGLTTAMNISKEFPQIKVVLVSMNVNPKYVKDALRAGVSAYILKDSSKEELQNAIHNAIEGKKYFSEAVMLNLAYEYMPESPLETKVKLTQRELEVLRLLAQEYKAPEIAEKLYISAETVETHKKNMLKKLGLKNSYSLIKYAVQNGLI